MIAILSDIHGNLPALKAVLETIDNLGCTKIISLGDITGYYSQPGECIDLLMERNAIQLLGNHDEYLISGKGCPRSRLVSDLLEHQTREVSKAQIQFLSTLSSSYNLGDNAFVHGGWKNPLDQYLYRVSQADLPGDHKRYFSGHTHVQVLAKFADKTYCNPGSVGQPRDGDWRAAFATLEGSEIKLHRVEYEIERTVQAMQKAGFNDPKLWENLFKGAQIGGRIDKVRYEPEVSNERN
jgi:predicted phosphodiesterase